MFKLSLTIKALSVSLLLIACNEDAGTKYIFNEEDYNENIEQYTLSKVDHTIVCTAIGMMFTKEIMTSLKDGKSAGNVPSSQKDLSPAVINVYKNKIEWIDLEKETVIKDGSTNFNDDIEISEIGNLEVIMEKEVLFLGYNYKGVHCKIPFSRV
ncbi:hypothetical protein N9E67_00675 [Amylibacter sp.]|nr:hypothetical protein [Amylibacter sp.]